MQGLVIPGYACNSAIWNNIKDIFSNDTIKYIEWPTNITNTFHKLEDYTNWIKNNYIDESINYDFIIGHSMGGLVALQLSRMKGVNIKKVIIIESFLKTPTKFFQNIVMDNSDDFLKNNVINMLKGESKYFSLELGKNLKDLDLSNLVTETKSKLYLIYGDRGINNNSRVQSELGLQQSTLNKLDIKIIPNSCHFPMLENDKILTKELNSILF